MCVNHTLDGCWQDAPWKADEGESCSGQNVPGSSNKTGEGELYLLHNENTVWKHLKLVFKCNMDENTVWKHLKLAFKCNMEDTDSLAQDNTAAILVSTPSVSSSTPAFRCKADLFTHICTATERRPYRSQVHVDSSTWRAQHMEHSTLTSHPLSHIRMHGDTHENKWHRPPP